MPKRVRTVSPVSPISPVSLLLCKPVSAAPSSAAQSSVSSDASLEEGHRVVRPALSAELLVLRLLVCLHRYYYTHGDDGQLIRGLADRLTGIEMVEDACNNPSSAAYDALQTEEDIVGAWSALRYDVQKEMCRIFRQELSTLYLDIGYSLEGPTIRGRETLWCAMRIANRDVAFPRAAAATMSEDDVPLPLTWLGYACFFSTEVVPALVQRYVFHVTSEHDPTRVAGASSTDEGAPPYELAPFTGERIVEHGGIRCVDEAFV